jgi:hypothetical protein
MSKRTPIGSIRHALIPALLASALLAGCASTQQEDLPQVDQYGLQLVENTRVQAVYRDPDADFSQFNRVAIAEVEVAFRKNWLRDQNRDRVSVSQRLSQEDADRIKAAVAKEFRRIFTEELQKGGYNVVDLDTAGNATHDLLLLRPAILNLDVAAPDTMTAGRSRTFTASAGSMTLYLEFHDALSGALLGRVLDSRSAPDRGYMSVTNSVTNLSEVDRMLRRWAQMLVAAMDRAHGKS